MPLRYMGLTPNTPIKKIAIDKVFIGSCTQFPYRGSPQGRRRSQGRHVAANADWLSRRRDRVWSTSGRNRRTGQGLRRRRFRMGLDKCSMCLAANARPTGAGRALRFHLNRNFGGARDRQPHSPAQSGEPAAAFRRRPAFPRRSVTCFGQEELTRLLSCSCLPLYRMQYRFAASDEHRKVGKPSSATK